VDWNILLLGGLSVVVAALVRGRSGSGFRWHRWSVGGRLTDHQLVYGATWVPALVLGFGLAVPLQKRVRGPRLRQAVLLMAALSSVAVILRSVV
jgi:hypothetical protein